MGAEQDPRLPQWLSDMLNKPPFLAPEDQVGTVAAGWGASDDDETKRDWSKLRTGELRESMFWNSPIFVRITWSFWHTIIGACVIAALSALTGTIHAWWAIFLFGVFVYWRWSPTVTGQIGWGHKLNGRWALIARPWHPDKKSAEGTLGPNLGQATGWRWGPH